MHVHVHVPLFLLSATAPSPLGSVKNRMCMEEAECDDNHAACAGVEGGVGLLQVCADGSKEKPL